MIFDSMKIGDLIRQALKEKGFQGLKLAAKTMGISQELLRRMVYCDYIPKDATLSKIAQKLDLDEAALILEAHREKVPVAVKGYFLTPGEQKAWQKKRVWPLSGEQCEYLGKVMSEEEIQIIRKLRQIPEKARGQIAGYVDYTWAQNRTSPEASSETENSH